MHDIVASGPRFLSPTRKLTAQPVFLRFSLGLLPLSIARFLLSPVRHPFSTCPNARSGDPGVSCRTLGARDCGLVLRVIAATLAYRRQHVVLGRDGAVVGLTVLVEECVVLGTRIGTYV